MAKQVLTEVLHLTWLAILCFAPYFASRGARNWAGALARGAVANICVSVCVVGVLALVRRSGGEPWLTIPQALGWWIFGALVGLVMHLLRTALSLKV